MLQSYNSQREPEKPLEHGHEHVLVLNMNPFLQSMGLQDVTTVVVEPGVVDAGVVAGIEVVVGMPVVPPHKHLNGHTPLTPETPHGNMEHCAISRSGTGDMAQLKFSQRDP